MWETEIGELPRTPKIRTTTKHHNLDRRNYETVSRGRDSQSHMSSCCVKDITTADYYNYFSEFIEDASEEFHCSQAHPHLCREYGGVDEWFLLWDPEWMSQFGCHWPTFECLVYANMQHCTPCRMNRQFVTY
tara:strand:+ start:876 stop:1271 length:396 start_codon:yes stop_codon:yes gene_type:complete